MVRRSASKYNRARIRARVRRPKRRGGSTVWTAALSVVVIVGVLAIVLTKAGTSENAGAAPRVGDHWHAFLGINACGTWLGNAPPFEPQHDDPSLRAGLHSHGDGLIHIHPFSNSEAGTRATVGRFMTYGGWRLSSTAMKVWDGKEHKDGQPCGTGGAAKPARVQWKLGRFERPWPAATRSGNPADYRPQNGDIIAIYFDPPGSALDQPPGSNEALRNISDLGGAPAATAPPSSAPGTGTGSSAPPAISVPTSTP